MTNWEKIKSLPVEEVIQKFKTLFETPLKQYIDYEAYLKSEDKELKHFLKADKFCKVQPCEAEILNVLGGNATEEQRAFYVITHSKEMPILEEKVYRFGYEYVRVADVERMQSVLIPKKDVII